MNALVHFLDGSASVVIVNASYCRGGIHYYNLTLNALKTFIDFKPGITKLFTADEITSLVYTMG